MVVDFTPRPRIALVIAFLFMPALARAQPARTVPASSLLAPVDRTAIQAAVEDATGVIWAISPEFNNGQLYRWQANQWAAVPGPGGKWMPFRLWHGPNGGVIAAWISFAAPVRLPSAQLGNTPFPPPKVNTLLTWQRGSEVRQIAQINGSIENILPAASGQLLITGNSPNIDRVGADGKLQPVYTLQVEQFFPHSGFYSPVPRPFYSFIHLDSTQDRQGRTWLWCDAPAAGYGSSVLQGVLLYNGKSFAYHRAIPGLPGQAHFSYLGPWDSRRLVAAVEGDGFYLIDTKTLTARRLHDPERGAFRMVQKVFQAGADRYVLSSAGTGTLAANSFHEFGNNLWRFRNRRWKKILAGVDNIANSRPGLRPWAKTRDGLWLATIMRGLWFIPANGGKPRAIDWREGFPFDSLSFLFALPQDRLLAINGYPQPSALTLNLRPASLLSAPAPPGNIRLLRTHYLLQPDQRHHIWGFVDGQAPGLDEWDGNQWLSHPLPPNLDLAWIGSLDADAQGRIWLFPNCRVGPSAFFDPRLGQWHEFASYRGALEEQREQPLRFQNPSQDPALPAFGAGGRIAFMGPCGAVHYFDGSTWRMFRRNEIVNVMAPNDGPPFFDKTGDLKMDIDDQTWAYQGGRNTFGPVQGGSWRKVAFDPGPVEHEGWFRPRPPGLLPEGCQFNQNSSLSRDRLGRYWWTWQGNLYEGTAGSCKRVLAANQAQPFIDGRELRRVLVDARGNIFFETAVTQGGRAEYVFLAK